MAIYSDYNLPNIGAELVYELPRYYKHMGKMLELDPEGFFVRQKNGTVYLHHKDVKDINVWNENLSEDAKIEIRPVAQFQFAQLPGCCGVAHGFHMYVDPHFRKKGLATFLLKLRLKTAWDWNYTVYTCTTNHMQLENEHLLRKLGFKVVHEFTSRRTRAVIKYWLKELTEEDGKEIEGYEKQPKKEETVTYADIQQLNAQLPQVQFPLQGWAVAGQYNFQTTATEVEREDRGDRAALRNVSTRRRERSSLDNGIFGNASRLLRCGSNFRRWRVNHPRQG